MNNHNNEFNYNSYSHFLLSYSTTTIAFECLFVKKHTNKKEKEKEIKRERERECVCVYVQYYCYY